MIQTIRIGSLLREAVTTPYRNLVTRPTGAAVRNRIEAALARSDCHTALLDFSDVELLDLSCADEVVAKLLHGRGAAAAAVRRAARPPRRPARGDRARADAPPARRRGRPWWPTADPGCSAGLASDDARAVFGCICERGRAWRRGRRAGARLGRDARGARRWTPWRSPPRAPRRRPAAPAAHRMSRRRLGLSTTAIHGAPAPPPRLDSGGAPASCRAAPSPTRSAPTKRCSTPGYGNTPDPGRRSRRKYALLEGAEDAIFLASGMGATALAHLAVLRPGDHLDQQRLDLRRHPPPLRRRARPPRHRRHLRRSRPAAALAQVDAEERPAPSSWRRPTNPAMRVLDLAPIAQVAREDGLALLVDATFASPINFRPLEHGADVVITSATKYLNGHSDVLAGAVAGSSVPGRGGQPPAPRAGGRRSTRTPRGWWTADSARWRVRMERHNANGLAVAQLGREQSGHRAGALSRASPSIPTMPSPRALWAGSAAWSGSSSRAAPGPRSGCSSA